MSRTDPFEVPPEMRALAEKSVEQARQAFEGFISAAQRAATAFGAPAESATKGARSLSEKTMTFAARNIANSFEFAQRLMRAKNVEEMLHLQADYIKTQMEALAEQAKELSAYTGQMTADAPQGKH